eukprot:10512218-Ditylum_brightwellii.AAC.1
MHACMPITHISIYFFFPLETFTQDVLDLGGVADLGGAANLGGAAAAYPSNDVAPANALSNENDANVSSIVSTNENEAMAN